MSISSVQTFKPAWWCPGAHAQTILGALMRPSPRLRMNRKRLELPDGDFLDVDFLEGSSSNKDPGAPLVVIFHGLEGSSGAPYVRSLLGEIGRRGWSAAAVNMRMCSGEPNRLKQTYHSGKTEDLDFVLKAIGRSGKAEKIYLVGYSIGGNIVLKWLGEQGSRASEHVQKSAAVSVPYDLVKSVGLMDRGFNREVYTRALLRSLKTKLRAKRKIFPEAVRYGLVEKCRTFREFDREVTARLNGFRDEMDYWSRSSCKNFLGAIRVPTLLIHADDDPFFPAEFLPSGEIQNSESLNLLCVPGGGHLGFVCGPWPWEQEPWLETQILDFLEE